MPARRNPHYHKIGSEGNPVRRRVFWLDDNNWEYLQFRYGSRKVAAAIRDLITRDRRAWEDKKFPK